ncbi:MAG: IS21 family transposase [Burkholderiales bacterium]|nr:IS21 family transposase [Burkholderiales bacterium]
MPNYLKMTKKSQVLALLELGWSYRRIEAETGVRRETVSRYDRTRRSNAAKAFPGSDASPSSASPDVSPGGDSNAAETFPGSAANPAKTFPGSTPRPRFTAALYRTAIAEKLDTGLSLQRIWQDLVEEYGYGASYESVKRFVRTIAPTRKAVGVFHCAPGAEGQVDFFRGAPTLDVGTGEWRRPWVFRLTLGHSRHGYEEAVWDQKLETFLRLHERAFRDLGGVPLVIRHDNLKAAVVRACFFDPDSHEVYLAFARHWGFTPLPTQPRTPQENGKQERSGGYVKGNALKGRTFDSLDAQNAFLRHWNRTIARLRIHGTTHRQVWTHFIEVEQTALQPLASTAFPFFTAGERTVHTDGHVEVAGAFYPVPLTLLGQRLRVQWDAHLVRVFHADALVVVHARVAAGVFAPRAGETEASTRQQAFVDRLVGQCERVGPAVTQWADAALAARGVRAIRLIQGVLGLTRRHPRERILAAVTEAYAHQHFRYQTIRRLVERTPAPPRPTLVTDDPAIRPLTQYTLEDFIR